MIPALFTTIWVSLALFVVAESGKRRLREDGSAPRFFWWASATGLLLAAVHVTLALAINHDWNHAVAWQVTETRTRELFGVGWGGALAGNYAFLIYWGIDLGRWRANPARHGRQSPLLRFGLNAFALAIIVSAAIVFVNGPRRLLGVLLVLALLWVWRPLLSSPSAGDYARSSSRR